MSESAGRLQTDPLFLALCRPAMIVGVTYAWFTLEGLFWILFFINTSSFSTLIPGALLTHMIGLIICTKEPRFIDLWMIWATTCTKCRNTKYHGNTHSYDLY